MEGAASDVAAIPNGQGRPPFTEDIAVIVQAEHIDAVRNIASISKV